jgi:hypothetical protein
VELNGDSILYGFGYTSTGRLSPPPADWLRAFGYPVDDRTGNGLSTHNLVNPAHMNFFGASHGSQIVVIQTGINDHREEYLADWPPRLTVEGVKQDYRNMVDHVRGLGKIPVIAGIIQLQGPPASNLLGAAAYNKIAEVRTAVRDVALEKHAHYASFDMNPMAWTDNVHLDQASSNGIAENLRFVLAHICFLPFP